MSTRRTFQVELVADRRNTARIVSVDGLVAITIEAEHEAMHEGINNEANYAEENEIASRILAALNS